MSAANLPWPTDIRIKKASRILEIDFDNGERYELPAEFLRVESPSAEVQGHGAERPAPVAGKREVAIVDAQAVGNYAVRLIFSDGHSTGLYSFDLLARLGREHERLWSEYLSRLAAHGLSR